jgi:hypothetical protein
MDAITIAKEIWKKVNELEIQKTRKQDLIVKKVNAQVEYDKALAIEIVRLRETHPVSILDKVAKGNIWKQTLEVEKADLELKADESNTRATMAQLNGLQSIAKNFGEL